MKVVVLGGYGNFGARICRVLAESKGMQLLIAGRNARQAKALADTLGSNAEGIALDITAPDLGSQLRELGCSVVIHTAGPFQQQGYAVAHAAANAGAHYIDLADGRRFVCDFPAAMHGAFVRAGRTGISGASTVPALSSAVVDYLCAGWQRIDRIDICIAPAQTAPRGRATLAAVLDYCGEPITIWRDGRWQTERGWSAPQRVEFARLRSRHGALCDIPDLELFPARYGVRDEVMFRAALEVGLTQRIFALMAALRSAGILRRPARWAGFIDRFAPILDGFGTALGGMVVRVAGHDANGQPSRRAWHIAADDDHGPEIPCMAAIVLARKIARGEPMPHGAFTASSLLRLAEFQPEFTRWGMQTDLIDESVFLQHRENA